MSLSTVLILVLMEDTLRAYLFQAANIDKGLNPCFNGRYSQRGQDRKPGLRSLMS